MIKISDIAERAKVSKTTVSKALNGYTDVSEKTRQKVLSIAKEMGYFPNSNAKALVTKRSWLVGILFTESLDIGLEHPIFAGVIEAFKNVMNDHGYDTIFINSSKEIEKSSYLNHCRYRNIEGVFVCTFAGEDALLQELFESDIKCVTADVDYDENVPLIISDNVQGIIMSYDYLYDMGHRNIAFVSGPQSTLSGRERLHGYKIALKDKGEPFKAVNVVYAHDYDYESGVNVANELLVKCGDGLPTAIIVAGDMMALGVIEALKEKGVQVPKDISIIGFDNIELTKYYRPRLTTVGQDRKRIGTLTAHTLLSLIKGEKVQSKTIIPVKIVERDTCRPIGK